MIRQTVSMHTRHRARSLDVGGRVGMTPWVRQVLVLSGLWMVVVLPVAAGAQPQTEHSEVKEGTPRSGGNGEPEREITLPDPLEDPNEPEDRLVILPEIKREGERHFLSSFKLPDKLTLPANLSHSTTGRSVNESSMSFINF